MIEENPSEPEPDAAAEFGKGFQVDTPQLSPDPCTAGRTDDGEFIAVALRFSNAPEFRFVGHHEQATQFIAAVAGAQADAMRLRAARGTGASEIEMPASWAIASRALVTPSPEGHLMLILWGEASAPPFGIRFTPQQAQDLHAALGMIVGQAQPQPITGTKH
jgi:hypothetical protein